MIDFLFISNGYGEDAIAAEIARLIPEKFQVAALPLVGEGKGYEKKGIKVASSFSPLPGAGVSLGSDLRGGLFSLIRKQWETLRKLSKEVSFAVVVGDIFPVFMAQFALKRKFIFVGTAKSVDVQAYNFFERLLLKKALKIFVRDQKTASNLQKKGVQALFVGNPMMDELQNSKIAFPPFNGPTIALLPGSRGEAPSNFLIQVEALHALQRRKGGAIRGIALLPPTIEPALLVAKLNGWDGFASPAAGGILGQYEQGSVRLILAMDCLSDVLQSSALVFGQGGTANEQAAGMGRPVVAFDFHLSRNGRLSWYRWRQKKLLNEALSVVVANAEAVAEKAFRILQDRDLYEKMSKEGKQRMGPAGGSPKIAGFLPTLL